MKIMAFDFNIMYSKRNAIQHIDALSSLNFNTWNVETKDSCEDRILHQVETDVLSFRQLKLETKQDPILKKCTEYNME